MPQYAAIIYSPDLDWTAPEQADEMDEYGEFGEAAAAIIRGGAALYPTATATTVRVQGGKGGDVVTTDGPYAETKEVLTGFYLLECADLDEAIRVAATIPGRVGRRRRGASRHRLRHVTDADPAGVRRPPTPEPTLAASSRDLVRDAGRDVLATLVRRTGDLALAEDAVQDASSGPLETLAARRRSRPTRGRGCARRRAGGPST